MQPREVAMGSTYRVEVPHTLPRSRYPDPDSRDLAAFLRRWRLDQLRGCYFELTVVDVDLAAVPPTVEGLHALTTTHVVVPLTIDQAAELGLPVTTGYAVEGVLTRTDGSIVALPDVETLTVPIRWLRPLASPPSRNHRDVFRFGS